jgi:tripartite-type tricarboxylate transporter receptor subunit TctC
MHAPPDGYTLMVTQNGHTTNPAVHKKLPYDTFRDFTPITPVAHSGLVLIATASTGVKSVKELIEFAARSPSQLSFASAETSTRLAIEQIRVASGLPINSVAYNGTSRAMTDLAAGHVNFAVTTIAATLPHKGTGRFAFLAVLAPERSTFLPDVPTLAEAGWPDCEAIGWWGIFGPAHMAPELVQTLNAAIRAAVASPEVQRKLAILSVDPWVTEPKEFEAFIRREVTVTTAVARRAGIEAE